MGQFTAQQAHPIFYFLHFSPFCIGHVNLFIYLAATTYIELHQLQLQLWLPLFMVSHLQYKLHVTWASYPKTWLSYKIKMLPFIGSCSRFFSITLYILRCNKKKRIILISTRPKIHFSYLFICFSCIIFFYEKTLNWFKYRRVILQVTQVRWNFPGFIQKISDTFWYGFRWLYVSMYSLFIYLF